MMGGSPLDALRQDLQARQAAAPPRDSRVAIPASIPGTPGYNDRIPPPDGPAIGEVPDGMLLPEQYSVEAALAAQQGTAPTMPGAAPMMSSARRVVVYCGRGDEEFILCVETPGDDEETLLSKKFQVTELLALLEVVRALGTKVVDRTGGELTTYAISNEQSRGETPTRIGPRPTGS